MRWMAVISTIVFLLAGCGGIQETDEISHVLGIDLSQGSVIHQQDSHGGFHGDGTDYRIISFEEESLAPVFEVAEHWHPLPLTENLQILIYGTTETQGSHSVSNGPYVDVTIPTVETGYYFFYDRQANTYADTQVLTEHSFNYTIAIYDTDTDQLYYCEYDT